MKTVIFVLAALVAVNAQNCSRVITYEQKIDPVVCPDTNMKLPNYENASTYYYCNSNKDATLTNCDANTYFNMATQTCMTCSAYFPSEKCESLKFNPSCVAIAAVTTVAPTTTTTAAPTAAPTTTTTEAPGESTTTTSGVPQPPTDSPATQTTTTVSDDDDIITPTGTTQAVPQPPSPGDSNVPTPVTPPPTAPTINDGPPTAPSAIVA
ncbi:uncharacterized protein [Drosophila takahashii]|uniref:uncharacterized protein n=1 Tax=Drosophila takahashii TaxID=29030 RepID=UPI001CF91958|nr:peritrophin-55 [Drosophila takahashii]